MTPQTAVGILRLLGPQEPPYDDALGPHTIRSTQVMRLLTRRLFDRPAAGSTPVPDAARRLPTVDSGDVSPDGLRYRIPIQPGIWWDAQQARELTAGDFVRGLKRIAYPTAAAGRHRLTELVEGLGEYCAAYDERFGDVLPTAPDLAQFHVGHAVPGLSAVDDRTLEIRLLRPAPDLLDVLATGFAAAAPREYDYYLPDDHELPRNTPSAGPYRVNRARSRRDAIVLEPNPRWDPDTDPIRTRTADRVEIRVYASTVDTAGLSYTTELDPAAGDATGPRLSWYPPRAGAG